MSRRKPRNLLTATLVVAAVASACAPPAPSPERMGFTEVCSPADAPLAQVIVSVVSTTSYGEIRVEYPWNDPDWYSGEQITFTDLVPGTTRTVGDAGSALIDPGRCLHVISTDPVVYRVTAVPVTDPGILFCYSVGLCPGERVTGYAPGYVFSSYIGSTAVHVTGLAGVTEVAAGNNFSCALEAGGQVSCWGSNGGALGDGTGIESNVPVDVVGITDATSISGGRQHACAIVGGGTIKCWGRGTHGVLGNGSTADSTVPVEVVGVTGATAVSAGVWSTCAVVAGGAVKCWGRAGSLGNGTTDASSVPVDVVNLSGVTDVAAGEAFACARVGDGTVSCWGTNRNGELGDGTVETSSTVPVDVVGITDATRIAAGVHHACALRQDGSVACWGANWDGELGDGTRDGSNVPAEVLGLTGAAAISAGLGFTCATNTTGDARCWGDNFTRRLGDGTIINWRTGVQVLDVAGATHIAAGGGHACALVDGGTVKCWGGGLLGNGT